MLGKLIKYELKASGRLIPLVYLVVGLLAVAGVILSYTRMYVYITISFILLFLAGAAAMIITYIIVAMRFYKGMLGAEGYLAHTLPVTTPALYFSKMIVSFIWIFLGGVVTMFAWIAALAALFNIAFREAAIEPYEFWEFFEYMPYDAYDAVRLFFSPKIIFLFIGLFLIGYVAFIAKLYFCITISSVRPFQNLGIAASVIAFIVVEIADSIIRTMLNYLFPLSLVFDSYTGWHFSSSRLWDYYTSYYYYPDYTMGIAAYILPILCAVGLPILNIWLLRRKVNLK